MLCTSDYTNQYPVYPSILKDFKGVVRDALYFRLQQPISPGVLSKKLCTSGGINRFPLVKDYTHFYVIGTPLIQIYPIQGTWVMEPEDVHHNLSFTSRQGRFLYLWSGKDPLLRKVKFKAYPQPVLCSIHVNMIQIIVASSRSHVKALQVQFKANRTKSVLCSQLVNSTYGCAKLD